MLVPRRPRGHRQFPGVSTRTRRVRRIARGTTRAMTPTLVDVVPLGGTCVVGGADAVLVSYEVWSDRSVVRLAFPAEVVADPPARDLTWALRSGGAVVAHAFAGGGGSRQGLNVHEVHLRP